MGSADSIRISKCGRKTLKGFKQGRREVAYTSKNIIVDALLGIHIQVVFKAIRI